MRLGVLVLVTGSLVLSACAKSDKDAAVDNGYCTQSTVDTFNFIMSNQYATSTSSVDAVVASCKSIQDSLQGRSCKAQSKMSGEEKSVSYADVQAVCEAKVKQKNKSESVKTASNYIDSSGYCTSEFAMDATKVAHDVDDAIKNKSKESAQRAVEKCDQMDAVLGGRTCKVYDDEKQEIIHNSKTLGYLGIICKAAQNALESLDK